MQNIAVGGLGIMTASFLVRCFTRRFGNIQKCHRQTDFGPQELNPSQVRLKCGIGQEVHGSYI